MRYRAEASGAVSAGGVSKVVTELGRGQGGADQGPGVRAQGGLSAGGVGQIASELG